MSASPSILTTKLYIPPARAGLVPRPRLTAHLADGLTRALTLISAPAGFGKTTLLSEWRAGPGRGWPLAWLSLDDDDNDPGRFLTYLAAALATLRPETGDVALAALKTPQASPARTVLTALINDLSGLPETGVLVLDDYHVITAEAVHEALTFLLDHLPPPLRLVLLTRVDPPLPLARLRARGDLTEIRAADLRFTLDEVTAFLNQLMGLDLPAEAIAALEARTEGWIAGLQLAALSMRDRDAQGRLDLIAAFGGSHQYVLDYLAQEVLDHQPEPVRSFLLQTSVLDRLCGPLCDSLINDEGGTLRLRDESGHFILHPSSLILDSQAMLEHLLHSNLFLVPLDDERQWYRYHHLFADVLNRRLEHLLPQQAPELHGRASAWYERNGFLAEAIHHALAAGDQGRALELIEHYGCLLLIRGEVTTLLRWIDAVEPHAPPRPWFFIYRAWARALTGDVEQAEGLLRQAEELMAGLAPAPEISTMLGTIAAARAHGANLRGEARRAVGYARQALDRLLAPNVVTCSLRTVATSLLGDASAMTGDLEEARQAYVEAARIGHSAGDVHLAVVLNSNLAGILTEQGQLRQAGKLLSETLALARRPDGQHSVIAGRACIELSQIHYEWNQLEAARQYAEQGLALCRAWGSVELQAVGYGMLARLEQVGGQPERAQAAMQVAAQLVDDYDLAPRHVVWIKSTLARLWIAQGDLERAGQLLHERGVAPDDEIPYLREPEYLALLRLLLAQGEYGAALALGGRLLAQAEAANRTGRVVEVLLLQALAWQGQKEIDKALHLLQRAISLAQPEGLVRLFLDEGEPAAKLLHRAKAQRLGGQYLSDLLSALGEGAEAAPGPTQRLIEPLSPRELEVLQLIADGCSNPQIAARLVISIPTVKRHLSNIYGKLGVKRRTQAIALARELKLFP